jgi:hypothetical protein
VKAPALPSNIRQFWNGTTTPAYYGTELVTSVKSFIAYAVKRIYNFSLPFREFWTKIFKNEIQNLICPICVNASLH